MRFLVQHQAAADDSFDVDYATNLSLAGLFISTRKPLEPRATLHVQFAPRKDAQLVSAFCRVQEVTAQGVRAEFVSLDAEAEQLIAAALA
ncbi:MAG: PilZ domain-containing protein [Myxococcota bacterium]